MASKVNVKFVVVLGVALTLVLAAMAGVFFFVLKKSGEDWAARGDEAMAAQAWDDADDAYSFAVAHDRTNVDWLRKWREAMERVVVENEIDFEARFSKDYVGTMRQISQVTRSAEVGAHVDYLEMQLDRMTGIESPDAWRFLLSEARLAIGFFEDPTLPPIPGETESAEWHRLYKYSGVAMGVLYSLNQLQTQEDVELAERHLRLALTATPSDSQVGLELAQLYALRSDRRRTQPPVDLSAADRLSQQSRAVLTEMLERNPRDAICAIGLLQVDFNRLRRDTVARMGGVSPTPAQTRELLVPLVARLEQIHALLMEQASQGGLHPLTVVRFRSLERLCAPGDAERRTLEVLDACLAAVPDDTRLLLARAEVLSGRGEHAEAVATLQRLIDLPAKPLGLEGSRLLNARPVARQLQADFTLARYRGDLTPEQRDAILAEAARYREELARVVAADDPRLLKIDGRMAYVRGDWANAERLLLKLNERMGGADRDVVWWLAQTAIALNKPGVALGLLNALNQAQADSANVMMALAAVEMQLRNRPRAEALARRLLEIAPDDPSVQALAGQVLSGEDPIRNALERYDQTARGGEGALPDPDGALAGLEQDFEANGRDLTLGGALMQRHLERRDLTAALGVCDRVLEAHPGQADFARFQTALRQGDLTTAMLGLIESGPGDDFSKALTRRIVYLDAGRAEDAARELAAAERIRPDDPIIVEARFIEAMAAQNASEVRRLVERARQLNIDSLDGDTFKFREQIYLGQNREAILTLESLVARSPNDAGLWRFLGLRRAQAGRIDDAVTALRRALQIRPNDTQAALELLDLLTITGRYAEGLTLARDAERFSGGSLEFLRRLWFLEAEVGNRQVALRGHEALRARDPALAWNNIMLADLYMDLGQFAQARTLIDELRAGEDGLVLVGLDARWNADQGNMEGARQAFVRYIGGLPPEASKTEAFIAMAQFMQSRENLTMAAAALETGRLSQPPETMDCDRMLGDVLTMAQRTQEAAEAYKRVVDGGADDAEFTFRKRMVECLIRLERYDEAETNLAAMSSLGTGDRNLLLLRAELAKQRGQTADALRMLDEAVRLFPEDAVAYFQRAELIQEDEARLLDALADYDSAIRKAPQFWQALRNRSGVYRRLGRIEEAVADLRSATLAAGTEGEAVTQLLNELMNLRRTQEAVTAADAAVAARPTDVAFMQRVGTIFSARGEWSAAAKYFKQAFDLRKEVDIAQRYLDCLLAQRPPQLRLADDVINAMGSQMLESPGLLAASVAVNARRARMAEAERDATLAFDKVSTNSTALVIWNRTMARAFEDSTAYMAYLRRLSASKQATALRDWPVLFLGMTQVQDANQKQTGLELLNRLGSEGQPAEVRLNALRTIGSTLYTDGAYSQAADLWRAAIEHFPDDWELNNNLAYTLTEHLNQAEEALPYALKAVEQQPQSPPINDTVGWAYFKTGDYDRAMAYLWRAARLSRDASEQLATIDHIIQVEIARQDKTSADRWLGYFRRVVAESPWLNQQEMAARAAELESKINSLP